MNVKCVNASVDAFKTAGQVNPFPLHSFFFIYILQLFNTFNIVFDAAVFQYTISQMGQMHDRNSIDDNSYTNNPTKKKTRKKVLECMLGKKESND